MVKLNQKLLEDVQGLLNEKVAFVPMPGGDPAMGGGDPAAGGMPPPGDPAAAGGMPPPGAPPMDPAAGGMPPPGDPSMGGMPPPPMDPAMGGMPPPTPPPPVAGGSMITMSSDEFLKFVKQIVALCTSNKFGADPKPTDGGPVSDNQASMNAKIDMIANMLSEAVGR